MKREYIKPEAEMMKFVEVEELMTVTKDPMSWQGMTYGVWDGEVDLNWR
ncbi:MAG: hypothetical protein IKJ16_07450 [Agathobacter sp.]|nr:hypothetical protein [Lachnospiraceae bacterium]MBR3812141.1 hypothetical protein [Agathobacter sp.]